MTATEFRAALQSLGLRQTTFCRQVEAAGGEPLSLRTVSAWATGQNPIPPTVPAILGLMRAAQSG